MIEYFKHNNVPSQLILNIIEALKFFKYPSQKSSASCVLKKILLILLEVCVGDDPHLLPH